jgi:plastocyanin
MDTRTTEASTAAEYADGWRRLGSAAAAVMVIWSIALQATAGSIIPPVAVVGAVFAVLAILLSRSRRTWVAVAGAVVPLLALAGNVPPIVHDLSHPEEGLVFALTVVSVVGALTTSLAGFMTWLRRPSQGARPTAAVSVGIVVVAAAVGAVAASGVESVPAAAGDVMVVAKAVAFTPGEIVLAAGDTGIWVDNADPFAHTFTIAGTDVDLRVPARTGQRVDVGLAPGTYSVICAIPGHESMTATLTVEG